MRSDGLRYCKFCDAEYLGGWCPTCHEKDARHEIRIDHSTERHRAPDDLDRFAATAKNLATLASMFPEPLKVPLAESVNRGMDTMNLQRNHPIYGVPPVIGEILTNNPNGLTSLQVLEELKERKAIPAHRDRQTATQHLNNMQENGWVKKVGGSRSVGGPLWRLTGKPLDYSKHGDAKRKKKLVKEVRDLRKAVNGGSKPALSTKKGQFHFADVQNAISGAIDILHSLEQAIADLETREFKLAQREGALETAKKLLAGI